MDRSDRASRHAIEKLILWHLWACAPFAVPWLLFPERFGRAERAFEVPAMRFLFLAIGASLAVRTWILLKDVKGLPWGYVWPLVDIGFVTIGAVIGYAQPDSWIVILYVLPVLQAAATLDLRWSITVAVISAIACGLVGGIENLAYSYFLFRLALLILVASLVTRLAKGLVRARTRLEVAQYRSDLAAEMHDGLQQYLGAIAMKMEMADHIVDADPAKAAAIAISVKSTARQASDELRLMLHRLRSPLLDQGTLVDALKFQSALFGERSQIPIELKIEGTPRRLSPKEEHAFLRIAQEALTNAAKHAEAHQVEVRLSFRAEGVSLEVIDDGKGIAPDKTDGIGMETIRNRADSIGAKSSVTPGGTRGTVVRVELEGKS